MVWSFAHDSYASSSPVQCVPDFQQDAFPILPPLMIPEAQFFDAACNEESCTLLVALILLRQTVLEAVQFHRHFCAGTKEIQEVFPDCVLATELESGKTPRPQGAP